MAIPYTFTETDLNVGDEFIAQVREALINRGDNRPIDTVLAQAADTVGSYSAQYIIEEQRWKRLVRAIALQECYVLLGSVPAAIKDACDRAYAELRDIRDGKFPLPPATEPVVQTGSSRVAWGSYDRIATR